MDRREIISFLHLEHCQQGALQLGLKINSPMKPAFFRQKIISNGQSKGYLAVTNMIGFLKGGDFKVTYNHMTTYLVENKKENGKRNWSIEVEKNGVRQNNGLVTMSSSTTDTLNENATHFEIEFDNKQFVLIKPFMAMGKEEAFLYDNHNDHVAHIILSIATKPRFKKIVRIMNPDNFTDQDIGFMVALLNTAIFVS